ncbi:MAG: hypothetical protein EXQ95_05855 [Alphaproteobacteria bacterium]|nr:hypothetical protein [Alphaproteobacteria bacterium]
MGLKLKILILLMLLAGAPAAAQPFAYVASDAATSIYVIDSATSQRVATVALPLTARVSALAVSNDGTRVYAASSETGTVIVVNAQTNAVIGTITTGPNPAALALSTDGVTIYSANADNATVTGGEAAGAALGRGTIVTAAPGSLALSPNGATLYVSHRGSATLSVITTSNFSVTSSITLPSAATQLALNPAGTRLYALDADGVLTIVDTAAAAVLTRRAIGSTQLTGLAVSPDGQKVLIADGTANTVTIADGGGAVVATLPTVGTPQSVAINPAGTLAYVVGRDTGAITVVNLSTNTVASTIAIPARGQRVAFARTTPTAATPQSGWWWNTSESGRGFSFETSSARMFFAYYLYAADGTATWHLGTASTGGGYVSTLDQYAGGQTLAGAFRAASVRGSSGQAQAIFFGPSNGALVWPGGTTQIQRFDIVSGGASAGPASGMPETGWWWNPSEPGRGFFIEVQSSTMFFATFLYDDRGEPVWYSSQNTMTSTGLFQGTLSEYANGQTLTGTYRAPTTLATRGTVTIAFSSRTAGTLTLPGGTSIPIQRFSF